MTSAARRASLASSIVQQPRAPERYDAGLRDSARWMPVTSWPASAARAAATAESTPPDMAATTLIGTAAARARSTTGPIASTSASTSAAVRCGRARSAASGARPPRRSPSRAARARAGARRPSRPSRWSTRCRGRRAASAASRPRSRGSRGARCRAAGRSPPVQRAPCRWASGTTSMTRRTRSSRSAATRAACSAWCLTASSTAAANPAIAGVSRVPLRMSRSWPPPWTSGVDAELAAHDERADAVRAADLVAGEGQRVDAGGGEVDRHRRRPPGRRRCAPGCRARPRCATTSSIGWSVPTSLLAHITEISATGRGSRSTQPRAARRGRAGRVRVDGQQLDLGLALVLGSQCSGSSTAWCSTAVVTGCGCGAGPRRRGPSRGP